MSTIDSTPSRRRFLHVAGQTALGLTGAMMLAGCGGGGGSGSVPVITGGQTGGTPTPTATGGDVTLSATAKSLNLALNLEYLGAQFYTMATTGAGLSAATIAGVGRIGTVAGGRKAMLTDAAIAAYAADLATDKLAHVTALRQQLGAEAAGQPQIDLSSAATSAFSVAAAAAGVIGSGGTFDAFASDDNFLLGAFLIENTVAATYRALATGLSDAPAALAAANLSGAIYQGGLIRTMLTERMADNATLSLAVTNLCAYLAKLDGTNAGDQTLANADATSVNIVDSNGNPIPFLRSPDQVLKTLYLTPTATAGGFLPGGANGVI